MSPLASLVKRWLPEVALVSAGIALRVRMPVRYDPRLGYDSGAHLPYIEWFRTHLWGLPPLKLCRETYHPPLYYWITGQLSRLTGGDPRWLAIPSCVFSCLALLVLWYGLERYLPGQRLARLFALALAVVMPTALHLTGMLTAEALSNLLALSSLLLAAELFQRARYRKPWVKVAVALGVVLGLQLLAKISALIIVATIGASVLVRLYWDEVAPKHWLRELRPWLVAGGVFLATSGWYFARNQVLYGKAVLTGFDGVDYLPKEVADVPYLDRRTPGYFLGWDSNILDVPYYPTSTYPRSRFWPVLIGTTFVDYFNFNFVRQDRTSNLTFNTRTVPRQSLGYARASIRGGTEIALATTIAWLWAFVHVIRRRNATYFMFLLAPLGVLLGQLHFSTKFAVDYQGPTKGLYMLFATYPLFAVFGLVVATLARRRWSLPLAVVQVAALLGVAAYSVYANFA